MNGSTKDIFAKRDVRMGEELCISYQELEGCSKAERLKVIRSWIGSGRECGCARCRREET